MQEQLFGQLVETLKERANLDEEKARQVARVVADFAQQHLPELLQSFGGGQDPLGGLGGLFGRR